MALGRSRLKRTKSAAYSAFRAKPAKNSPRTAEAMAAGHKSLYFRVFFRFSIPPSVLDFQGKKCNVDVMGNEKFEDISVLKALVRLRTGGLLHPDDSKVLLERLQTDWGRKAAADLLSDNHEAFAEAKSLLRRFSVAA